VVAGGFGRGVLVKIGGGLVRDGLDKVGLDGVGGGLGRDAADGVGEIHVEEIEDALDVAGVVDDWLRVEGEHVRGGGELGGSSSGERVGASAELGGSSRGERVGLGCGRYELAPVAARMFELVG
jgi:hypothetical protein